ncbi:DUF4962 domain-containing protein [Flavobacterium sp. JAS]|uniref:DUF4962 domain-containing protein n=1 Tax=Flavobacterium sp. JAS TaxID=2897329 RepID=UPI001E2920C1|nr:DUF4962 domain-containing protein [Flavobacterium sp. JAS]MCD0472370.1 DUF4962 domain-containing protein [Flavobacterium sp. JAS]
MKRSLIFLFLIFNSIGVFAQAELPMDLPYIMGDVSVPQPQGIVDENPVWLHVNIPILDGTESTNQEKKAKIERLKFQRRFYFKLSKSSSFTGKVYESGPKRYGFYSPYEQLSEGTWYWKYGIADPDTPDRPVWNSAVYSFVITGKERLIPIPPKPEEVLNAIISRSPPVGLLFNDEFTKLVPTKEWPELANFILIKAEDNYNNDVPMTYTVSEQDAINEGYVDANGKPNAELLFYRKLNFALFGQKTRYIRDLMSAYLLIGDIKYRDRLIEKIAELTVFYESTSFYFPSINATIPVKNQWGSTPQDLKKEFIDLMPEALTENEKETIIDEVYPVTRITPEKAEYIENTGFDQHLWQEMDTSILETLIYARYSQQAREEFKYLYEIWLYRAPVLSRTDGASQDGDGYLGVHDDYLTFIPYLFYKLTGHNYYKGIKWFENLGKYLHYTNPFATNPTGFTDGDGPAATMPSTMEAMAYMVPENNWNLLRHKIVGRLDYKNFNANFGKKTSAYSLLSMWKNIAKPDLSKAIIPDTLAAEFSDFGEVGMHTTFLNKNENFQVTLHSSPYGSMSHTHPAQNAFNMALGGQDMFWKVGFYNGGGPHNVLNYKASRAHNTIMADSLGQGFHTSAYGWIPRFVTGKKISYALGDASNAYNGANWYVDEMGRYQNSEGKDEVTRESKPVNRVYHTREFGFGNPGVTRFRRHLVMLRPNYVLIYDELEAETAISWQFNLHSRRFMKQLGNGRLMGVNDFGATSAKLFCTAPIITSLDSKWLTNSKEPGFVQPPKNKYWLLKPWDDENKLEKPIPNHYHATIGTAGKHKKMRFLTVFEVHSGKNNTFVPTELQYTGTDLVTIQASGYTIKAQLNAEKPSFLEVKNLDESAVLITGQGANEVIVNGRVNKTSVPGATLLIENGVIQEDKDKYPDALIYGNKY